MGENMLSKLSETDFLIFWILICLLFFIIFHLILASLTRSNCSSALYTLILFVICLICDLNINLCVLWWN